jgi:hypothetical protein
MFVESANHKLLFFNIPSIRNENSILQKHPFRFFGKQGLPVMGVVLSDKKAIRY